MCVYPRFQLQKPKGKSVSQFDDLPSVPRPQQRLIRDLDPVSRGEVQ